MPGRAEQGTVGNTRPIRVLWVIKELAVGGAERLLLEIAPVLQGTVDFLPTVVFDEPRTYEDAYRDAGFEVRTLGAKHPFDPRWMVKLRSLINAVKADVVHLHLPYVGALGRLASLGKGHPIVYTEHNLWSVYSPFSRLANALTFPLNDAVISVSGAVRTSTRTSILPWLTRGGSRVVNNGVSLVQIERQAEAQERSWIGPQVSHPCYGTVSNLRAGKGVDVLLLASLLVREQLPSAKGFVIGTGKEEDRLRGQRSELNAPVDFLGMRHDARGLIDALDVFVLPSRVEGLPVALLEAMALGKPIVASRAGGIPEAVEDGESGLLVDVEDASGLAAAIVRLLEDRELGRRLGARAREVVQDRFSAESMARGYLETYTDVLRGLLP